MYHDPAKQQSVTTWVSQFKDQFSKPAVIIENATVGTMSSADRRVYFIDDLQVPPPLFQPQPDPWGRFPAPGAGIFPAQVQPGVQGNTLRCVSLAAGKLLWSLPTNRSEDEPLKPRNDFRETHFLGAPLPVGGKLYFLNEKKQEIRLVCLDLTKLPAQRRRRTSTPPSPGCSRWARPGRSCCSTTAGASTVPTSPTGMASWSARPTPAPSSAWTCSHTTCCGPTPTPRRRLRPEPFRRVSARSPPGARSVMGGRRRLRLCGTGRSYSPYPTAPSCAVSICATGASSGASNAGRTISTWAGCSRGMWWSSARRRCGPWAWPMASRSGSWRRDCPPAGAWPATTSTTCRCARAAAARGRRSRRSTSSRGASSPTSGPGPTGGPGPSMSPGTWSSPAACSSRSRRPRWSPIRSWKTSSRRSTSA